MGMENGYVEKVEIKESKTIRRVFSFRIPDSGLEGNKKFQFNVNDSNDQNVNVD